MSGFTTICLSLPWIFLFIILRAQLPLNTGPLPSVLLTFGLMGVAGWAWPARVFDASIRQMRQSGWLMQARVAGIAGWRIAVVQAWPHLRALAVAQFRVLVPAYILSEASLGLLGLGVADPLPSWGNLLQDLQHPDVVKENPWVLAPLGLLVVVMILSRSAAAGAGSGTIAVSPRPSAPPNVGQAWWLPSPDAFGRSRWYPSKAFPPARTSAARVRNAGGLVAGAFGRGRQRRGPTGNHAAGAALALALTASITLAASPAELRFSIGGEPRTFDPLRVEESNSETVALSDIRGTGAGESR